MDEMKSRREILQISSLGVLGLVGCMGNSKADKCLDGTEKEKNEYQEGNGTEGGWPHFGCNLTGDHKNYGANPNSDAMELAWDNRLSISSTSAMRPLIRDDVVYAGWQSITGIGKLYALDAKRGEQKWVAEYEGGALLPGSVMEDSIYAGSPDGIHSFNVETGELSWSFRPEGDWKFVGGGRGTDKLYVFGISKNEIDALYAVDPETGEIEWEFRSSDISGLFAVQGDSVYTGGGGNIHRISKVDGSEIWSVPMGYGYKSGQIVANGETIYAIGKSNRAKEEKIFAIDDSCGQMEWSVVSKDEKSWMGMAASPEELYVSVQREGTKNAYGTAEMIALDRKGGSRLWTIKLENMRYASVELGNPIIAGNEIYVGGLQRRANRSDIAYFNVIEIDLPEGTPVPSQAHKREINKTIKISEEPMYVSPPSIVAGKDTIYTLAGGVVTAMR